MIPPAAPCATARAAWSCRSTIVRRPEHKWPAAPKDAFKAWTWVANNAHDIDGNPAKIAVAGESAGGNLAAVVCLLARDQGVAVPVHQLLIYPVTDVADGVNSVSARENADAKPLNAAMLKWFYNHYLPQDANRRAPDVSPLYAKDHAGLPPATIILAELDPLRSDGEAYAAKLEQAGVPVTLETYAGVTHEFFGMAGIVSEATNAIELACDNLEVAFEGGLAHSAAA